MNLLEKVKQLEQIHKSRKDSPRPRHYAEAIMQLKTREERAQALEQVPEEFRHIVKFYIYDAWARRNKKPLPTLERT